MSASSKLLCHRGHVHVAPAAKTHFDSAIHLFMSNEGTLDTDNPKTPVDHVLGIGSDGTGACEVVAPSRQPGQATVAGQLDPFEQPATEPDPSLRTPLVQLRV